MTWRGRIRGGNSESELSSIEEEIDNTLRTRTPQAAASHVDDEG
jgi:hypothetical protein